MRQPAVWMYRLTALITPMAHRCSSTDAAPSSPGSAVGLCDVFRSAGSSSLVVEGFPVHVEDVKESARKADDLNVTPEQLKAVQAPARDNAVQDVRLFRLAEKNGYLRRPEVQQKLMSYIARSYLQESGLEGQITEEAARRYYEEHIDEFTLAERRIGRHILLRVAPNATDAEAARVKERIDALHFQVQHNVDKMEFARLAHQHSEDRPTADLGGLMDPTARNGKHLKGHPELAAALFGLERPGDVSLPVRTSEGWHLVQLASRIKGRQRSFEPVKNLVTSRLQREQRQELIVRLLGSGE